MNFRSITVHPSQLRSKVVRLLEQDFDVGDSPRISDYRVGKRHLYIAPKMGEIFHICASLDRRYICCGTHVISHISNCPFECSYCFLQNYLTDTTLTVIADTQAIVDEVRDKTSLQPWRLFRVGTWELGDSLAVYPLNEFAVQLVEQFAKIENCILKLRTKSKEVTPLLTADHRGRTVVSWTVNPEIVIKKEEFGTASLSERIASMRLVAQAGYPVGLHFDPMILFTGWQGAYRELVDRIFSALEPGNVIWISLGSLRFNPEMKKKIENNYPVTRITAQEMVLGDDNKYRYLRPIRVDMYRYMVELLKEYHADEAFIYLCMERWNVWEEVFGRYPQSIGHLDYLIADSVWKRFPDILKDCPDKELYLTHPSPFMSDGDL